MMTKKTGTTNPANTMAKKRRRMMKKKTSTTMMKRSTFSDKMLYNSSEEAACSTNYLSIHPSSPQDLNSFLPVRIVYLAFYHCDTDTLSAEVCFECN